MVGVGFAIARLHSPVVFGVLGAFAALLPAVGISAVLLPAVVYLAFSAHWGAAIFLAFWGILIIVAEHLLRPLLTSRHGEVSSLATFIGAIGGVAAFGFIGLILGPVLLSLIVALVRITEDMIVRPE
jgi:predicted PurR-regulated permease PerM